ncbi:hypothetical protein D9619_002178 [Psilocybe cf. subviscida]|uniref:Uncharacterized protein n=1 Tax=Psilocybe cf. subviscida TaxID=2480587 RepID=A0A8H5BCF7_9AGAR|nr:hypothetical protein D9619_002178 [Psilocybe cf. subviscida]
MADIRLMASNNSIAPRMPLNRPVNARNSLSLSAAEKRVNPLNFALETPRISLLDSRKLLTGNITQWTMEAQGSPFLSPLSLVVCKDLSKPPRSSPPPSINRSLDRQPDAAETYTMTEFFFGPSWFWVTRIPEAQQALPS